MIAARYQDRKTSSSPLDKDLFILGLAAEPIIGLNERNLSVFPRRLKSATLMLMEETPGIQGSR
jgi:hypothetical protein